MADYPSLIVPTDHIEPVPRRVRAVLNGRTVLDTTRAIYVWEWPPYPQFYIPVDDIDADALIDEDHTHKLKRGTVRRHGLRVGDVTKPGSVRVFTDDALPGLAGMARLEWDALDSWFEEDEQIFVHPRSPYSRVDAVRSNRRVRVSLDDVTLADSSATVMVFETGLPTRYYFPRTSVDFTHLLPSATVTACPYKGTTSGYWSVLIGDVVHPDLAWAYDFPTTPVAPIAGLVAFSNEKVDIALDGAAAERPVTHFSA